jgi:integrative and conjugative element protein (TIGR02256 family)
MPRLSRRRRVAPGTAWLFEAALLAMGEESSRTAPRESGGMLLGYRTAGDVVIRAVVGPGPNARHAKSRFEPDGPWQERELAAEYRASGRTNTYLGDWHSHPRGNGRPSRRDLRTARKIARHPEARTEQPLMTILVPSGREWEAHVHRLTGGRFVELEVITGFLDG